MALEDSRSTIFTPSRGLIQKDFENTYYWTGRWESTQISSYLIHESLWKLHFWQWMPNCCASWSGYGVHLRAQDVWRELHNSPGFSSSPSGARRVLVQWWREEEHEEGPTILWVAERLPGVGLHNRAVHFKIIKQNVELTTWWNTLEKLYGQEDPLKILKSHQRGFPLLSDCQTE